MNFQELLQLLRSAETAERIDEKRAEIEELIPDVKVMYDYDQKMKRQCFDLWTHSLNTVVHLPKDLPDDMPNNLLYFAALVHDIGKPEVQTPDKKKPEFMDYPGHEAKGVQILEESVIPRINKNEEILDEKNIRCLKYYVGHHHDLPFMRMKSFVRKQMQIAPIDQFLNLMRFQIADCKSQYKCTETTQRVETCTYILKKAEDDVVSLFTPTKWLM